MEFYVDRTKAKDLWLNVSQVTLWTNRAYKNWIDPETMIPLTFELGKGRIVTFIGQNPKFRAFK